MSEPIDDIVREMRKMGENYSISESNDCRYVAYWLGTTFADRIEAAVKAYNKGIAELLVDVIGEMCLHCDLQTACQEKEDGMSITCNAALKATHFIEQHKETEP